MFLQLSSLTLQSRGAAIQTGSHPWPSCYSLTMGSSWESARRSWPKPCQEVTNMSCHTPLPMSWHWWNTARVHRLGHGLGPRRYSVNVFSMNDSCEISGKLLIHKMEIISCAIYLSGGGRTDHFPAWIVMGKHVSILAAQLGLSHCVW